MKKKGKKSMCFKTRMIEECGKLTEMPFRSDIIGDLKQDAPTEYAHSTIELAQLAIGIRELASELRELIKSHPLTPPCDETCGNEESRSDE
jgi:hypothetical protein